MLLEKKVKVIRADEEDIKDLSDWNNDFRGKLTYTIKTNLEDFDIGEPYHDSEEAVLQELEELTQSTDTKFEDFYVIEEAVFQ